MKPALLLRGLDALTSSETIIKVLNEYSNYNLPVKQCHIAKDIHTNVSNGFAFVEMSSIQVVFVTATVFD